MIINEQIRRYNERMEEIEQLEFAEALAVNQLKLKRQNTVRSRTFAPVLPFFSFVQFHFLICGFFVNRLHMLCTYRTNDLVT